MLESLGTEKSSLVFQLERLETQLKSVQGGGQTGGPAINMSSMESPGEAGAVFKKKNSTLYTLVHYFRPAQVRLMSCGLI